MKVETATKDGLIQARVPLELKEQFQQLAERLDVPPPQILRKLIADFVKREQKKMAS